MKIETFYEAYNLKDIDIIHAYNKNDKMYLLLDLNVDLTLMGNGIRPVLKMDMNHMFIFDYKGLPIDYRYPVVGSYELVDNRIHLKMNDSDIDLSGDIEIIENYIEK